MSPALERGGTSSDYGLTAAVKIPSFETPVRDRLIVLARSKKLYRLSCSATYTPFPPGLLTAAWRERTSPPG